MFADVMLMRILALLVCTIVGWPATLTAQETRAETLARAREEKQKSIKPYEPNMLETGLKALEKGGVPLITRDGIYLKLGSLTTGSGFAYGAGFRNRQLFDGVGSLDLWAGASRTKYWATEGRIRFPHLADGWLDVQAYARRHEYPQEDFFGLGPDSRRGDHTDYGLRSTMVGSRIALHHDTYVSIGGGAEYVMPRVMNGTDDSLPSIGERFTASSAPGLFRQSEYLRSIAFIDIDYRRPLNARKGGWYRLELSHYDDRDRTGFSFDRLDVDLRQFVSFLSERRVLFGRVFASTSDATAGQQVPFYLMPTLGGNDSLRGFREYRFRGPHALLLQGEYRFEIWSGLDGAVFYDAGKVAMQRSQLGLRHLESDYGFGFRFNTDNGIVFRIDSAFGSRDGKHLWIVFGGTF